MTFAMTQTPTCTSACFAAGTRTSTRTSTACSAKAPRSCSADAIGAFRQGRKSRPSSPPTCTTARATRESGTWIWATSPSAARPFRCRRAASKRRTPSISHNVALGSLKDRDYETHQTRLLLPARDREGTPLHAGRRVRRAIPVVHLPRHRRADVDSVHLAGLNMAAYTHAPQKGEPGHCFCAQVFGPDGKAVLTVESTADPAEATHVAQTCASALSNVARDTLASRE